ncbi:MAG TPA: hypothetical protein VK395_04665 [Gemmataceae bacterium]|nr:hypothetical protein [Gemmataceae bacterium]
MVNAEIQLSLYTFMGQADVVLSGAANVDQLNSNLAPMAMPWSKDASHLLDALKESQNDYWNTRAGLAWN